MSFSECVSNLLLVYGVTTRSLMLCCLRKFLNVICLNWDPLSVVMHLVHTNLVKILSRLMMMVFAVVVFNTDVTGNLDRQSVKTRMFSSVGNCSLRSITTVCLGLSGISLMSSSSYFEVGVVVTWYA